MSHSGLCHLGLCYIQDYVAFVIHSFMIMSFGVMSFGFTYIVRDSVVLDYVAVGDYVAFRYSDAHDYVIWDYM